MSYSFPEGSRFYFSADLGTTINITGISNANPGVATTAAAHGMVNGDQFVLQSGWDDATDAVFRVASSATTSFAVSGLDTTQTQFFPVGGGGGTARKIGVWTEMLQVLDVQATGGDVRYTPIEPLSRRNSIQVPTGFNPSSINFVLGWDPNLAFYQTLLGLSRTLTPVALRITVPGMGTMYGYGNVSASEIPQMQRNQANRVQAAMSLLGRPISYPGS
jgi:hypothetical protein